ncbi:MAG: aspartate aminotransferase family protein [Pseudomonadota bacterium]
MGANTYKKATVVNHMPNSPEARDIAYHFHSYTNAIAHAETGPMIIDRGEGVHVWDNQGTKYIEAMAGLWSAALGFSEDRLIRAATEQMQKLPYYHNFTHKSHDKAIDLAEKLIGLAPVPMSKVFYTNSGSEANDTVLKMIWYRSNSLGQPEKKKIISRIRGYHGVTLASASLTGLPYNHKSFDLPIDGILHTSCPHYWKESHEGETEEQFATRCAEELEAMILEEGPETVAAFIGEPVMGAGGVVVPPATYWDKIQDVLNKYDILLIADEVICGFGRTGNMFGCETFNIKPDVMVMSKQITSSYAPFSAFMINERFYEPIAEESGRIGVLGHGFTGAGHPVGAAVALENITIIEERDLVQKTRENSEIFLNGLHALADHPLVGEVRGVGMIAAVELVTDKQAKTAGDVPGQIGLMANKALIRNGVIVRNIQDSVAFCPPLIISEAEVRNLLGALEKSLDEVQKELGL